MTYDQFAQQLLGTQILSDPWLGGRERFRLRAVVLEAERAAALGRAAEQVAQAHEELAAIVWKEPALLDSYFHLTPWQKLMWLSSGGAWHAIARADLFFCIDGQLRCCELNSDTPSGEAEAVLVNQILHGDHGRVADPNQDLGPSFLRLLQQAGPGGQPIRRVGLIYPTELTEDLSMIALYRGWLEAAGLEVVLGSPFNLTALPGGQVGLFGRPIEALLRHYKTDWWGEREPAFLDEEEYPDSAPLETQLNLVLEASHAGRLAVINPFGAVLTQNKLGLAFMTEHRDRFSPAVQQSIAELLPETRRVSDLDPVRLRNEQRSWVLKSDFGCEGSETLCGIDMTAAEWSRALEALVPGRWVAQRFFEVAPEGDGLLPNFGVYLVGGRTAGIYTRLSPGATGYDSVSAATYVTSLTPAPRAPLEHA